MCSLMFYGIEYNIKIFVISYKKVRYLFIILGIEYFVGCVFIGSCDFFIYFYLYDDVDGDFNLIKF